MDKLVDTAISKGCTSACAEFLVGCDVAGGGPEDLVGDVVCGVATAACPKVCNKIVSSIVDIKKDKSKFESDMC